MLTNDFFLGFIISWQTICAYQSCPIEECTQWFSRTKDYEYLVESSSERYCQVLQTYIKCLNDSIPFCRGHLKFHSIEYLMKKQWNELNCSKVQLQSAAESYHNRCHFLPAPAQRNIRYCSVYGQLHVRKFDGFWSSCTNPGALAVTDNRYFIVQITDSRSNNQQYLSHITQVTVILRPHNCTLSKQLTYSTSLEDTNLPISFMSGVTSVNVDGNRRAIEVLRQSVDYIELNLRYIDSSIHIRRRGNYMSVSVRSPQFVLQSSSSTSSQLCLSGCHPSFVSPLKSMISMPEEFSTCQEIPLKISKSAALERCQRKNLTDSFLDTCIYDVLLTDNEDILSLTYDVQQDFKRVFPLHYHYTTGRQHILHENYTENFGGNCILLQKSSCTLQISLFLLIFFYHISIS
ncbi:unnamed protein product [Auanema sp. JU1783]|nr:unnamed protein product [Auanema sp. JU1783]